MVVPAAHAWGSNGDLIADVAKLGYISGRVYDPTFGEGTFWGVFTPSDLLASDSDPDKSPVVPPVDFTRMPWNDAEFDTVVFDPPYKLNGTPSEPDARYGVHEVRTWQERIGLMVGGLKECARVLKPKGHLLVKCQDQVCSGKVRWQSDIMSRWAESLGLEKVDAFYLLGKARKQPMEGRAQRHAHGRPSQLLVFRK